MKTRASISVHPKKHERAGSDQRWKILQTLESAPKLINQIKKLRWIGMEEREFRSCCSALMSLPLCWLGRGIQISWDHESKGGAMNAEAQASVPALDRTSLPALEAKTDPTVAIPKGRQAKDSESKPRTSPEAVVIATIPPPAVLPEREPWSIASGYGPHSLDRAFKANLAKLTFGLSPAVMAEQTFDWMVHFAFSPGKQLELAEKSFRKSVRFCLYATESFAKPGIPPCISPLPNDRRFVGEAWQRWPYNLIYQSFLLTQQLWHSATTGVDGVSPRNERSLSFTTRQVLDVFSPSNLILTNPEVLEVTATQGGRNLLTGLQNLIEDCQRTIAGKPPLGAEQFVVGQNVAITPGKVVYQNHMFELIQYAPSTKHVYSEPVTKGTRSS
jgi:hypothetical protein